MRRTQEMPSHCRYQVSWDAGRGKGKDLSFIIFIPFSRIICSAVLLNRIELRDS